MPRSGSGEYSLPPNTAAQSGEPVSSTKFNALTQDLEADANAPRPIVAGGTGGSTGQAALNALFSAATPGGADKISFWDQSAGGHGWLGLGAGIQFDGTQLVLSEALAGLSGLAAAANNFIVGKADGSGWEVKSPSDTRSALGATAIGSSVLTAANAAAILALIGALAAASYTAADVLAKLLTLDGAGSGVDADLLDGLQGSAYGKLSASQTWGGNNDFEGSLNTLGADINTTTTFNLRATQSGSNAGWIMARRNIGAGTASWAIGDYSGVYGGAWNGTPVLFFTGNPWRMNDNTIARVAVAGTNANSGRISWGSGAPGTLAEGEIYLRHA